MATREVGGLGEKAACEKHVGQRSEPPPPRRSGKSFCCCQAARQHCSLFRYNYTWGWVADKHDIPRHQHWIPNHKQKCKWILTFFVLFLCQNSWILHLVLLGQTQCHKMSCLSFCTFRQTNTAALAIRHFHVCMNVLRARKSVAAVELETMAGENSLATRVINFCRLVLPDIIGTLDAFKNEAKSSFDFIQQFNSNPTTDTTISHQRLFWICNFLTDLFWLPMEICSLPWPAVVLSDPPSFTFTVQWNSNLKAI